MRCTTTAGNCPTSQDSRHVKFHDWFRALSFANGRAEGQQARYRVYSDGTHWRTRNLVTRDEV